jgi:SAM-dependent methyltransferase
MQNRHENHKLYFNELAKGMNDFVIPSIESVRKISEDSVVLEIGCGFGGNLKPFFEKGCRVIGIDKSENIMKCVEEFSECGKNTDNLTLMNDNFYEVNPNSIPKANLVLIRDVLEHIVDRKNFFERLKDFLASDALIFIAFPPWRMPFGGHQQGCKNFLLSRMPYYHLIPWSIFEFILKIFGEDKNYIMDLRNEVWKTRLSVCDYKKLLKESGFKIERETYYLINPSYKIKFGLNPRILPNIFKIPFICDFYTTAHYSIISRL